MVDREDADHVTREVVCGKGGYVRAIARDLGMEYSEITIAGEHLVYRAA